LTTQPSATEREDDLIPPRIIGIQALACAPLWTEGRIGIEGIRSVSEHPTLAEGVKVRFPVRGADVLRSLIPSDSELKISESGSILVAREEEILPGQEALAHLGFFVEPTSALIWSALRQTLDVLPDPIVVLLTGSGYKYEKTSVLGK
jgi:threonine synthase